MIHRYHLIYLFLLMVILSSCDSEHSSASWTNWGGNLKANPQKIWYPKDLNELKQIVQEAHTKNINVHPYGSGHSWSDLVPTDGYMINTRHLNRPITIDLEKKQVQVEAGMSLGDLNALLDKHGLALANVGRIYSQSIAGLTATGTHGTGHTPSVSSFITGAELLTANGSLLTISEQENPELLPAIRLSLGGLGVIYSLTLQCVDSFFLSSRQYIDDLKGVLKKYPDNFKDHDFWMFEWNPYTDKTLCYAWDRTEEKPQKSFWRTSVNVFKEGLHSFFTVILKPFPSAMPSLIDFRFRLSVKDQNIDKSYQALSRRFKGLRYVESEWAVESSLLPKAIDKLKGLFQEYEAKGVYATRVSFRSVSQEPQTLLSPN